MSAPITVEAEPRNQPPVARRGEPAWDVALLFPVRGEWTEADYLALRTNRLIELSDGCLEILPMPTKFHQRIVKFLLQLFDAYLAAHKYGEILPAPFPVRLWSGKFREPDLVFTRRERGGDPHRPQEGADLVVEVVSPGDEDRNRDLEIKRTEYARAGIGEYWIVDPASETIMVLVLDGAAYREHGVWRSGSKAASVMLPAFEVDVGQVFAAGRSPYE